MKKYILYIISIFSLLSLISCVQEFGELLDSNDSIVDNSYPESVIIKARISDETDTKTYFSDDTGENGSAVKIYWSESDYIKVNIEDNSYNFSFQGYDDNMTYAYFKCSSELPELTKDVKITAEYPSSGEPDLSSQYGILKFLSIYHYMTAEYTPINEDSDWDDVSFTFKTQTPILKLTLKNDSFKGKIINNLKVNIGNKVIVSSTTNYTGSEDNGEITAYFAIHPQEIRNNTLITAICDGVTYEASIEASKMLEAGKLYRINKVMEAADLIMTYKDDKAFIYVFDGVTKKAVTDKISEAINDSYTNIEIIGTLTDDIKDTVNELLINTPENTVLTIDNRSTFYVYDSEGFMAWGAAAERDGKLNCTLINNIELTKDWEYNIGTSSTNYTGIFEGNNHIIKGLSINQDALRLEYYHPLALISHFAGELRNLVIEGGRCVCTNADVSSAALVVGQNLGIIDGVSIRSNVGNKNVYFQNTSTNSTSVNIGVIAITNAGIIKNCINELPVNISISADIDIYAGGIVSTNVNYIIQCINDGDITVDIEPNDDVKHYIGGIVGNIFDNKWYNTKIYLCANRGVVNGGIAGFGGSASGSFVGNYTTHGNLIYSPFYTPDIDDCYTTDVDFESSPYYVSSLITVYENMNDTVLNLQCEHIDKKWKYTDGYLELESL